MVPRIDKSSEFNRMLFFWQNDTIRMMQTQVLEPLCYAIIVVIEFSVIMAF